MMFTGHLEKVAIIEETNATNIVLKLNMEEKGSFQQIVRNVAYMGEYW